MKHALVILGVATALFAACSNDTSARRVTRTTTTYESKPETSEKTVILTEPRASQETIILQPKADPKVTTHSTYRVETHRED